MVHDSLFGLNTFWKWKKKKIENLGLIIERLTVGIAWHSCCGETFCFVIRPSYVIRIYKEKKKRPSGVAHCVSTSLSIQENWRRHLKVLFGDGAKISFVSAEWTGRMWDYKALDRYSDIVVCSIPLINCCQNYYWIRIEFNSNFKLMKFN